MSNNTIFKKTLTGNWMAITVIVLQKLSMGQKILEIKTVDYHSGIGSSGNMYIQTPTGKVAYIRFDDPCRTERKTIPTTDATKLDIQEAHETFLNLSKNFIERISALYVDFE